mmetsp:Transcript_9280/g.21554  ORF Transcript_9280/g.21554 Transcript_9280/m.21554 type:complete len:84 (+) Transcript_9280:394-645(+)
MPQVEFSYILSSSAVLLLPLKVGDESALRMGIGTLAGLGNDREECSLDADDDWSLLLLTRQPGWYASLRLMLALGGDRDEKVE